MTATSAKRHHGAALSERQATVLRAVVASYVGEAAPVGSKTLSHLLPMSLSSASIRNTLVELTELGLIEKRHASAGRVPSETGLRRFVDELLAPGDVAPSQRRELAYRFDDAQGDGVVSIASELLSRHTRQLGFVVPPRLDRMVLRGVSLVRLSSERLLVVLVAETGAAHHRVVEDVYGLSQPELDQIAALLRERVAGLTLLETRERIIAEARALRHEANELLVRALDLGTRALAGDAAADLVIETRLALLDQPEFNDPQRLKELFQAIETKERLLDVLDELLGSDGVSVGIGGELEDPALQGCAVVATHYGEGSAGEPLGVLGVIGPSRMDFGRVIPLVDYLSELVTGKLRP